MEIFKEIAGYERYSVSNYGRVINNTTNKELSQRKATNGYLRVNLRKGNIAYEKPHVASVHRLVADAFLLRETGKDTVNHIDGNKMNNYVGNLEWCSIEENLKHAWNTGLMTLKNQRGYTPHNPRKHHVGNQVALQHNIESHNTPEYRTKMQKVNAEAGNTKPVKQIDIKNNEVIDVYDNCHEAARNLFGERHINKDRLISRCARGEAKTAYGYVWRYGEVVNP